MFVVNDMFGCFFGQSTQSQINMFNPHEKKV